MSFLFYFLSRIPIFVHFLFKFAPMGVSLLPLTFFIIRHLRIGMEAPWVYIFFAAYAVLIIVGFVFAICLIKNKKTRNAISKAALAISSVYLVFFSLFIYLTIAARLH